MQERVAVRAVVRGLRVLRHDFSGGGPCPVALRLAVRNCLGTAVSLSMEARPRQPIATPGGAPAPGTFLTFQGVRPSTKCVSKGRLCCKTDNRSN